jgi:hypothetical protein
MARMTSTPDRIFVVVVVVAWREVISIEAAADLMRAGLEASRF